MTVSALALFCLTPPVRNDVSAKQSSTADFELSVACLINMLLCDEELFGPGMRQGCILTVQRLVFIVYLADFKSDFRARTSP